MKTILIVWLLAARADVQFMYAIKFPTEQACIAEIEKHTTYKDNPFGAGKHKVKQAECVLDATK